ncbi:MAG: flagellar basal body P-ring formation chaperone FlgA [Verrucomicrobiota bacterium]|jgi:flagella basal body P-ring formation protein FlgA|nr:flagellar basal body P-ring formation chaperone FlgA [Verrucomicrobiota bacterium]
MKRLGGILLILAAAATLMAATKPQTLPASDLGKMLELELEALLLPKKNGELELIPTRPLPTISVPANKTVQLRVLYHPGTPMAYMRVKFSLRTDDEQLGEWTVYYRAKLYRDVWVARSPGQTKKPLDQVDLAKERRDVINVRQALWQGKKADSTFCLAQGVSSGSLIYDRHVKFTPVVKRGQVASAFVQIRSLTIRLKVEVLEDGAPGETVRMRNLQTKKELRGTVINGKFIKVSL